MTSITIEKREHVKEYDLVRVIATILVVIGHSAYIAHSTGGGGIAYVLPPDLSSAYYSPLLSFFRYSVDWIYSFHMPLFFILSGAVFMISDRFCTYDTLIIKKIKRLIIPFFVYGLLFMIPIKLLCDFYILGGLPAVVQAFLLGGESGHLWFLFALFWCFCVYYIIEKLSSKSEKIWGLSIWFPLFCACLIQIFSPYIPVNYFGFETGMSYIFYFALGAFFEKIRHRTCLSICIKDNKLKSISLLTLLVFIVLINIKYNFLNKLSIVILCSFAIYLISVLLCDTVIHRNKIFNLLLAYSFYIYLFHDPLEYIVLKLTFELGLLSSSWGCYLYLFLRIIGVIIISIFLGFMVKKIKRNVSKIGTSTS